MSIIKRIVEAPVMEKVIALMLLMLIAGFVTDYFTEDESEAKVEAAEVVEAEVPEEIKPPEVILQYIKDCRGRRPELTEFMLNCAKNANPMSDEEGEDLVYACKATAIDLVCTTKIRKIEKIAPNECIDADKVMVTCTNGSMGGVVVND